MKKNALLIAMLGCIQSVYANNTPPQYWNFNKDLGVYYIGYRPEGVGIAEITVTDELQTYLNVNRLGRDRVLTILSENIVPPATWFQPKTYFRFQKDFEVEKIQFSKNFDTMYEGTYEAIYFHLGGNTLKVDRLVGEQRDSDRFTTEYHVNFLDGKIAPLTAKGNNLHFNTYDIVFQNIEFLHTEPIVITHSKNHAPSTFVLDNVTFNSSVTYIGLDDSDSDIIDQPWSYSDITVKDLKYGEGVKPIDIISFKNIPLNIRLNSWISFVVEDNPFKVDNYIWLQTNKKYEINEYMYAKSFRVAPGVTIEHFTFFDLGEEASIRFVEPVTFSLWVYNRYDFEDVNLNEAIIQNIDVVRYQSSSTPLSDFSNLILDLRLEKQLITDNVDFDGVRPNVHILVREENQIDQTMSNQEAKKKAFWYVKNGLDLRDAKILIENHWSESDFILGEDKDIVLFSSQDGLIRFNENTKFTSKTAFTESTLTVQQDFKKDQDGYYMVDNILSIRDFEPERVKANPNVNSASLSILGNLITVYDGGTLVADEAMTAATRMLHNQKEKKGLFAAMHVGTSHYDDNGGFDHDGVNLVAGYASEIDLGKYHSNLAFFAEFADTETKGEAEIEKAHEIKNQLWGLGASAHIHGQGYQYYDASIRAGYAKTTLKGDLIGTDTPYHVDASNEGYYVGGHIGTGWSIPMNDNTVVDLYGRYQIAYRDGDKATVAGDVLEMPDSTMQGVNLGVRMNQTWSEAWGTTIGLGYEMIFDGEVPTYVNDMELGRSNIEGSSVTAEFHTNYQPSEHTRICVGLKTQLGERTAYQGMISGIYRF